MPTSIEDLIAQARPVTRTVRLCLRGDLIAAREAAERELAQAKIDDARENRIEQAPVVAERIRELEAESDAAAVEFKVKALGRTEWLKLLRAYPPSDEEKDQDLEFGEGFPAAAVAACVVDPEMTIAQAERLFDTISQSQFNALWTTVLAANIGGDDIPKSFAATATLAGSETRSTTAPL